MKRALLAIVASCWGLAAVFSYKVPTTVASQTTPAPTGQTGTTGQSIPGTTGAGNMPGAAPATQPATPVANGTVNGPVVTTLYGPMQVAITLQDGTIANVTTLRHPTGGMSDSISARALPVLQTEAVTAQSANIASVSGATYTSGGFKQSLQAAITSSGV